MSSICTPGQLAAARAMLHLTQAQVAEETGIAVSTLRKYETGTIDARADLLARVQGFYKARGVLFVNRSLEGVYLEHSPPTEDARVEIRFKL
ncbi:MAG: helix-turn-helix transcriptional regulator [Pseudomonadota bacterium]